MADRKRILAMGVLPQCAYCPRGGYAFAVEGPGKLGKETKPRVDWLGAILVTTGLAGVTYAFIESTSKGWTGSPIWGAVVAGGACLAYFRYFEGHASAPMVPFELFRSTDFSGANLLTFFVYAALGILFFLFPLNLIQVQGYSATATGAAALPFILLMFLLSRWSGGLVARFGARRPLIAGPIIAAIGFLCFVGPSVGGSYWRTFFPGFIVLGLGMAVSVAPLTTVVMDTVDQNLAGTASGINNALARIGGLLAIAVLGTVMVSLFSHYLNTDLTRVRLPISVVRAVQSNEIKLAAITIPAGLDSTVAAKARSSINAAFVFGFRLIMLVCAGLCVVSSFFAWRLIGSDTPHGQSR